LRKPETGRHSYVVIAIWGNREPNAFGPSFYNSTQARKLAEDCRKYHFNAVFVQMRRRGDAFYIPQPPNSEPRTTVLEPGFDALAEVIKACHEGSPRIEVHCWLVSHFVWAFHRPPPQPEHVFNRHPDWLTRDSIGQRWVGQGYYLDPGHPATGQLLRDVAVDIVSRYNVDGLHWDYLRYPSRDAGYNPLAIARYNQEFGTTGEPAPDDPRFCEWRRRQVTDFLRWTTAELLAIRPRLVVSAAVFSNYEDSRNHRFADWVAWCREGILDAVVPMNFSPDNQNVFASRAAFARTNQGIRTVYLGQGAYMNTAENTRWQLSLAREMGFDGTVLYSYRNPVIQPEPVRPTSANPASQTVDNHDAAVHGAWKPGYFGEYHGKDYLFAPGGSGTNRVTFVPRIREPGHYDVYEWHVAGENRAEDVPHEIVHSNGTNVVLVNQRRAGAQWNLLGRFRFFPTDYFAVSISDRVTNQTKVVVADAIRFEPAADGAAPVRGSGNRNESGSVLKAIRQHYQPNWTSPPQLAWKANPQTGIIKGRIVTQSAGAPLYNAEVEIDTQPPRRTRTDALGNYALFEIAPGVYSVSIRHAEAGRDEQSVRLGAGEVTTLNVALEE
jgi:uncharacterized lipoprotein YddW (UPF0748 family)